MTFKGVAKGRTIELDEELPYPDGQPVTVSVSAVQTEHLPGSPAAIRRAMHESPHLSPEDVEALERAIEESQLPLARGDLFDEEAAS